LKPRNKSILQKLAGGDRRSLGRSAEVVQDVLRDPTLFESLFDAMENTDPAVRIRAADAVEKISRRQPQLLAPFKSQLIDRTAFSDHAEVRWHVAQMLPRLRLSSSEHSAIVAILSDYLMDRSSIVRTSALQSLADLLQDDARSILEEALASGTPAMRARARKLLTVLV
jgi:hypothetical protein